MPLYEYQCTQCGKRTEVLQKFDDAPLAACPACGGEVKKMVSSPAFQFKGSGWYVTDYAGKKGEGSSGSKSDKDKSEASGESKSDAAANSTATSTPAGSSSEPAKSKEPAAAKASGD